MTGMIAVTGGTGFIGRRLVQRLVADGRSVRMLCRDPAKAAAGTEVVVGALEDAASLSQLVAGSAVVVHMAGALRATDQAAFERANALGTANVVEAAATAASRPRLLVTSSLAARVPTLSAYAASKWRAEGIVREQAGETDFCILRPPAVYGPGDLATLPIFQQLRRGFLVAPAVPAARFSLLFVDDLVDLVRALLAVPTWAGAVLEPDDGRSGGYRWPDLAGIAAGQLGRRVRLIRMPFACARVMAGAAEAYGRLTGRMPMVDVAKVREMFHDDWLCRPADPASTVAWVPQVTFEKGCRPTMSWYVEHRWL
jgi:nucleoside-diphosphate-sugar epimerase